MCDGGGPIPSSRVEGRDLAPHVAATGAPPRTMPPRCGHRRTPRPSPRTFPLPPRPAARLDASSATAWNMAGDAGTSAPRGGLSRTEHRTVGLGAAAHATTGGRHHPAWDPENRHPATGLNYALEIPDRASSYLDDATGWNEAGWIVPD